MTDATGNMFPGTFAQERRNGSKWGHIFTRPLRKQKLTVAAKDGQDTYSVGLS